MSHVLKGLAARMALVAALGGSLFAAGPEETIRRLQEKFIAPCCWSESVAVHRSEIAAEMRTEIGRLYREGVSEKEITARYVSQYGERILMEPTGVKSIWLIVIPVAVAMAGTLMLVLYLRRRPRPQPEPNPVLTVSDEELDW